MRRNKYGVAPRDQRTDEEGIVHDSKGEMGRWRELQEMERRGEIIDLQRQVPFRLELPGDALLTYVADFVYDRVEEPLTWEESPLSRVVEDWKPGVRTEMYRLKKRLMKALHGIEIYESGRKPKKRRSRAKPPRTKRV